MGAVLASVGCGHSEPFASTAERHDAPFEASAPVRLSLSTLSDFEPAFSEDGQSITYVYEESGADHDRCLGIMPAGGGTRRAGLCAWYLGQADSSDGLESAALRHDGMLAFTMYTGGRGGLTSHQMGLYLGDPDSIQGARRVLALGQRPAGASASWSGLIDPVWLPSGELMGLAISRFLVNASDCGLCPPPRDRDRTAIRDTIPIGIELARLRIDGDVATVVATIPMFEAIAWTIDQGAGMAYYIVQRARPDLAETFHESLADSVYAIPIGGGAPVLRYGTAGLDAAPLERLHGVASGGGRLFISRSWRPTVPPGTVPIGATLLSDISEVMADGSLRQVAPAFSWRWGRIRASADGRHLLAEAVERTTSDIYQIEVGP